MGALDTVEWEVRLRELPASTARSVDAPVVTFAVERFEAEPVPIAPPAAAR